MAMYMIARQQRNVKQKNVLLIAVDGGEYSTDPREKEANEVQTLQPGLNIVKTTYSDGHTDVKKVLKKQNNSLRDMIVPEAFSVIVTSMTSIY